MNEFSLISNYLKKLTNKNPGALNLQDDVFFDKKKEIAISIDTYNEKIHFPNFSHPDLVIKKILRSSISDLISKGVSPKYFFISASGNKKHFNHNNLKKIFLSLKKEQKKYDLKLSGGDTVKSKNLSFAITTVGYSKKITKRNNAAINDDIYVTGDLGDSFIGLKMIKKSYKVNKNLRNYFISKYYCPDLSMQFSKYLYRFANSSMDISDGLVSDLTKLIKSQSLSYELILDEVPVSKNLILFLNKFNKKKDLFVCNGDDYKILFTAPKSKRSLIKSIANKMNQKVTIIGKINNCKKNKILFENKVKNLSNYDGYSHKF
tara:strand:- start:483 stop:1439 length:957 start_codon:yes stop_codon:yes gene_type:complete